MGPPNFRMVWYLDSFDGNRILSDLVVSNLQCAHILLHAMHATSTPWGKGGELDAGWPESEEEQVGNVKLEEDVRRRSKGDNQVKTNGSIDNKT